MLILFYIIFIIFKPSDLFISLWLLRSEAAVGGSEKEKGHVQTEVMGEQGMARILKWKKWQTSF